ncbi:MAG TPA: S8 family serine peptidase [Burkholderiaceae bacterium]|nr:S8 family serine peptidase [Burkholderiaceae bacterium]
MHDLPPNASSDERPKRPAQPYLDWALATGFSYLREGKWIPLLIEFNATEARKPPGNERLAALEAFATRRWLNDDPRTLDDEFVIPDLFANPPALLRRSSDFNFSVGLIKRDVEVVRRLTQLDGWNRTIHRVELGPPINFADKTAPALNGFASGPTPPSPTSRVKPRSRRDIASRTIAAVRRGIARIRSWLAGSGSPGSASAGAPPPPPPPASTNPAGTPGTPSPGSPRTAPPRGQSQGSSAGSGSADQFERVVIAVIDQGIAFANSRFFTGGAPRIEYLWQQNVLGTTIPAPGLTMPFTPGFELNQAAIINAVAAARLVGADDEWAYRNFGGLNFGIDGYKPLARRRTHGTHVLDLAASVANPAKHPIIAVDMPEDAVGDPAGSTLAVQAAWGLIYILDRAEKMRKPNETLPVVANLSYGPHEGPHDGTSLFEAFMDAIYAASDTTPTPIEIVLAAGNYKQTRAHAAFDLASGQNQTLQWRLQPGSLTASLMEIWLPPLPPGSGHQVTVTLTPPNPSATLTPITVSTNANHTDEVPTGATTNVLYQARYELPSGSATRDSIVLSIARTAPDPDGSWGQAVVPSGIWMVTVQSATPTQVIHAWIRRSDTLSGRRAKGRQSYFDDPDPASYQRFWPNGRPRDFDPVGSPSYVRRMQTLSGIATGDEPRIIGGYCNSDSYPAHYSSHGTRVRAAVTTGPDWLECSDDSDVLRGVHAAGTQSGSVAAMNGTSVSAPQATRCIAQAWLGLAIGQRPGLPPGLLPIVVPRHRPIPLAEFPFAATNGRAPFAPRWPPRRPYP